MVPPGVDLELGVDWPPQSSPGRGRFFFNDAVDTSSLPFDHVFDPFDLHAGSENGSEHFQFAVADFAA